MSDERWAKAHYEHDMKPVFNPEASGFIKPADDQALIKVRFHCAECGGTNLVSDGPCVWDYENQIWVLSGEVYDDTYCEDCQDDVRVEIKHEMVGP